MEFCITTTTLSIYEMITAFFHHNIAQNSAYIHWRNEGIRLQIMIASLMTGSLYLLFALIDYYFITSQSQALLQSVHLYCLAPLLFSIALLAIKRSLLTVVKYLMLIAPILANLGNMLIVSVTTNSWIYFPEIYLSVVWVFVISGLPFQLACISGVTIVLMQASYGVLYLDMDAFEKSLHLFWLSAALLFGIGSAFLFELLNRVIYSHYHQANQIAMNDSITQLPNSHAFDTAFSAQLKQCADSDCTITFMMLQVNNASHPHEAISPMQRKNVLKELAPFIIQHLPQQHQIARLEGDLFVALLYDLSLQQSLKIAHKLCDKVDAHTFTSTPRLSLDIGITLYQKDDSLESIYARGYSALHQAQHEGENRVILH